MYVEKRGRGRKRAREEDGQVTEAGQREAGSRVALVDPSAHEQLPEEDLMEWYEETMKMAMAIRWRRLVICRLVALLEETMAKRELMAHLYLNTLAPQPPEVAGIRLRAWEGSRTLRSACLDVAETAACLGAAEERKVLRGRPPLLPPPPSFLLPALIRPAPEQTPAAILALAEEEPSNDPADER